MTFRAKTMHTSDKPPREPERAGCIDSPMTLDPRSMPETKDGTGRTLIACSLWLHMGFAGATAVAAGLLELFNGEATLRLALTVASLGCVLAIACWRLARIALDGPAPRAVIGTQAASQSSLRAQSHRAGRNAVGTMQSLSAAHEAEPR